MMSSRNDRRHKVLVMVSVDVSLVEMVKAQLIVG